MPAPVIEQVPYDSDLRYNRLAFHLNRGRLVYIMFFRGGSCICHFMKEISICWKAVIYAKD